VRATLTKTLRAWYGLSLTLRFYGTHWAALGPMPPHPQLVNMILRAGLEKRDSLHLQVLHELGHLQSLPLMFVAGGLLLGFSVPLWPSLIGFFLLWEVLSEAYVIYREGRNYFRIYGFGSD